MDILVALIILLCDIILIYKNKNNPPLLVINFFLFFVNYSICVGIYILNFDFPLPTNNLINSPDGNLFEKGLFILLTFQIIRLYISRFTYHYEKIAFKNNFFIYIILICALAYIGIFEIDRSFSFQYKVKISAIYEYSYILFALLLYYQGTSNVRNLISHFLALAFILQDAYYGGRVTSLQIILTFGLLRYYRFIRLKYIVLIFPITLLLFTIVGSYRTNYSMAFSIENLYDSLANTWFVQDTALFSYFASIGHLYADLQMDFSIRLNSFFAFLSTVFLGSSAANTFNFDPNLPLVTSLSKDFHVNIGGGVIFTWFYFWFGWTGVLVLTSSIFGIIKQLNISSKNLAKFVLILIAVSSPRWYLYNPLAFFRGPLVLFPILYLFFQKFDTITRIRTKNRILLEDSSSSDFNYKN